MILHQNKGGKEINQGKKTMAPVFAIPENIQKLWDAWNVRVFIIISFSVQAFLLRFAPLRQRIRSWGKWVIWLPYLFANWVATYTIGLIFHSNSSTTDGPSGDIMAFWVPFLLLHLAGPDNITSYSIEDNNLWQRHLLELVLQFCFTFYIFLKSFSRYELWLPTLLVLFAGMVKYVERIFAFYRASLDHFGEKWQVPTASELPIKLPIPAQFKGVKSNEMTLQTAVLLLGSLKSIIIGPAPKEDEQKDISSTFLGPTESRSFRDALQIIEIELSLLYELLHTKLPVIASTTGFFFRVANFSCILVALLSFSLVKKHYQLGLVDILLTYGLLIGALALDILSTILITKCSDWFAVARLQDQHDLPIAFINRRRWCKKVSQLNFLTYHVKDCPVWLKDLDEHCMWSLLKNININFRCRYNQNFQDPLWRFIWRELLTKREWQKNWNEQETWLSKEEFKYLLLKGQPEELIEPEELWQLEDLIDGFIINLGNFSRALLVWHIGTELCFQDDHEQCRHESEGTDYRSICKLLSDYMFYLAAGVQPSMIAAVLDDWKKEFAETCDRTRLLVPWSSFSNEKTACQKIFRFEEEEGKATPATAATSETSATFETPALYKAVELARWLKNKGGYDYPWELMSQVWVHLIFFAAVSCSPYVHARQLSKGGELLTLVWLSLNHLGLGIKYKTLRELFKSPRMEEARVKMVEIEKEMMEQEEDQEKGNEKERTKEDYYRSFVGSV